MKEIISFVQFAVEEEKEASGRGPMETDRLDVLVQPELDAVSTTVYVPVDA